MSEGLGIFVLIVVAVVIFYLLRAIRMVPQGYNYTWNVSAVTSARWSRASA